MMMFMVTEPRSKLKKLAAVAAMGLLVGVAVPVGYHTLTDIGAMSLFAAGDNIGDAAVEDAAPGSDTAAPDDENGTISRAIQRVIFGDTPQVVPY